MKSNFPFDSYDAESDEDDDSSSTYISKECTHCGKSGFHWEQDGSKWILVDSKGQIHNCPKKKQINLSLNSKI